VRAHQRALQLGAQHSQAFESWLAHIPGIKVVSPGTPYDAKGLLKSAIRDDNPVVFLEGEMLYNTKGEVPEGEYTIPIGVADVKREGTDVTIVTWGAMVHTSLSAADLKLIKLGGEVHGPEDYMDVSVEHILYTEDLRGDSKIVQAIAEYTAKSNQ